MVLAVRSLTRTHAHRKHHTRQPHNVRSTWLHTRTERARPTRQRTCPSSKGTGSSMSLLLLVVVVVVVVLLLVVIIIVVVVAVAAAAAAGAVVVVVVVLVVL